MFVSRLGLGCVTFGREVDETESFHLLDQAVDGGITLLDTAEGYGGGNARLYRQRMLGVSDVREQTGEMHSSEKISGCLCSGEFIRAITKLMSDNEREILVDVRCRITRSSQARASGPRSRNMRWAKVPTGPGS